MMEVDRVKSVREAEENGERAAEQELYDWCCTCASFHIAEKDQQMERLKYVS